MTRFNCGHFRSGAAIAGHRRYRENAAEDAMRMSVFGLGYAGAVSAACMARQGHWVIGVDPDRNKVDLINTGASPIIESGLREMLCEYTRTGQIEATTNVTYAVHNTDVSFVSVGTPSRKDG